MPPAREHRRLWNQIERSPLSLAAMCVLAFLLYGGANVGLGVITGYSALDHRLSMVDWPYLLASVGGVAVALGGYRLAFDGISRAGGGPSMGPAQRWAAVVSGFGGFLIAGGSAVDKFAMRAAGADQRDAEVRVGGLDALEHAPLALGCCVASIFLLVTGRTDPPPLDFVWPWAVAPPFGALLAVLAARRYRGRFRDADGVLRFAGLGLDSLGLLGDLIVERTAGGLPFLGMSLFWAGEIASLWCAFAAFGWYMSVPSIILTDAVGYALTRRSAPLGGAGLVDLCLPLVAWDAGAPLAAAVAGTLAYRFFSLWLPLPAAIATLPTLRAIGSPEDEHRGIEVSAA